MNLQELKKKIENSSYKVISFDIFDTLIKRPCVSPTDILKLVGKRCNYQGDFLTMRRIAEKEARNNKLFWEDEISYEDIYVEFERLFDISHEQIEKFKESELEVEYDYLSARESMQEIFDYAISIGKEVIIVSDIYLPYEFMEKVLTNCGYKGYSKLYLSSEYKCCKNTGKLYEIVKKDFQEKNIDAQEILHMGDNENSDVNIAKKHGFSVQFIPRIEWLYRKNRNIFLIYDYSVMLRYANDTFLIGWAINKIYDDPFIEFDNNTYFNGSLSVMGQIIIAPLILSFIKLVLQKENYLNSKIIGICGKDNCFVKRMIEVINFACNYNKKIVPINSTDEDSLEQINAIIGSTQELKKISEKSLDLSEKRFYSPYVSVVDKDMMKEVVINGAKIFDFDTNRTVPMMNCLINSILFEETSDRTIIEMRKVIEVYIKSFVKNFRKDFDNIILDFTLFNEYYEKFLTSAKGKDAEILKNISLKNTTLYDRAEKNLYEQWYKSHNK